MTATTDVTGLSRSAHDGAADASDHCWPEDELEVLGACPICQSSQRVLLFGKLQDRTFFSAPGSWKLWSCSGCGCGYLDPRPTEATIGLAYRDYYTHEQQSSRPAAELSRSRRIRRALANGYKNWKFGTRLQPSCRLGVPLALSLPAFRAILDRQYRHLKPAQAGGRRVLDVGMGDGGFVENAAAMGWTAVGTDTDSEVVENARRRGLDARLGTIDGVEGPFHVITMSHVIEHLHDPNGVLSQCHRLLAPCGTIWIETPNIDALGFHRFGADWRGLEPPRHLVLFNRPALELALAKAGFVNVRDLVQPSAVSGIYEMSARIKAGVDPHSDTPVPLSLKFEIVLARLCEWLSKPRREFLAVTARKAG